MRSRGCWFGLAMVGLLSVGCASTGTTPRQDAAQEVDAPTTDVNMSPDFGDDIRDGSTTDLPASDGISATDVGDSSVPVDISTSDATEPEAGIDLAPDVPVTDTGVADIPPESRDGPPDVSDDARFSGVCPTAPPVDFDNPEVQVACGKLVYVAGGDKFHVLVSSDEGKTWLSYNINNIGGDDYVNSIKVAKGIITIVGLPGLYTSVDKGQTFARVEAVAHNAGRFDASGGQINYGAGRFILTDNEGTYFSTDGATWQSQVPFPDKSFPNFFGGHYHGVAYAMDTYLVFQDKGAFRTFNGTKWTQGLLISSDYNVLGLAYGNGVFAAVGGSTQGYFTATSTDGTSWTNVGTKDSAGAVFANLGGGLIFDGTKFHSFTQYSPKVGYTSTDGVTWTKITLSVSIDTAAHFNGHFFGVGGGGLLTSSDGVSWTSVHTFTGDESFNINGPRVAIGYVLK